MHSEMRNPCKLKVTRYGARMITLNAYLAVFPGAKASKKISETELNGIILNIMPNGGSKQAYVQYFDCESNTFKNI